MEPARLGLIGAGRWGKAYIRTIASLQMASLAAVASTNPETKSLVPAGCLVTPDWRALIALPSIDAVIVATPPALHHEMAIAALEAGKPVLVEKPFTCDPAQAEAIAALAQGKGLAVMVEHTHLFAPAFRALSAHIQALGGVRTIRGRANADGPIRPDVPVLWDWGAHDVAMCIDLLGPPQRQSARRLERRAGIAHAERLTIALEWLNGVTADIECSNITGPKRPR
jgi:predicted dehydrogenase